jgi:hypothetical protein
MKSNDLDGYEEERQHKFIVTIDDGVDAGLCRYEFLLPDYASIYDLAKAIANKFDVKVPQCTTVYKTSE